MNQDPLDYPVRQYGFMLAVAPLGGIVPWTAKVRKGELGTPAFAGLLAFWFLKVTGEPGGTAKSSVAASTGSTWLDQNAGMFYVCTSVGTWTAAA